MFIIGWISLIVYCENTLPEFLRWKQLIINNDTISQDKHSDLVFHESLENVFGSVQRE